MGHASSVVAAERIFAFRDLGFAERQARSFSTRGTPFYRKVFVGMPKLNPNSLDLPFYLYRDPDGALKGEDFGGTGFFVAMPSEVHKNVNHLYAITNWHVACRDGFSVVRVNTKDGGVDTFDFGPEDWEFDPKYDIAAIPIPVKLDIHKVTFVSASNFVTESQIEEEGIGPGEDVFMVGRFIDHDGGLVNLPAVRFGNISVMPTPIEQPNGGMADSYCLDMHSRSGYSGSPVFMYRTPGYDLTEIVKEDGIDKRHILLSGVNYLGLLGIHFAQFPELWEIADGPKRRAASESSEPLVLDGKYVKGLSGMTCVLPAWNILKVLNMPKLKAQRARDNAFFTAKFAVNGGAPEAESAGPVATDENPTHREDFMRLANAAARKQKPDE